jgi:hypothetical protein
VGLSFLVPMNILNMKDKALGRLGGGKRNFSNGGAGEWHRGEKTSIGFVKPLGQDGWCRWTGLRGELLGSRQDGSCGQRQQSHRGMSRPPGLLPSAFFPKGPFPGIGEKDLV